MSTAKLLRWVQEHTVYSELDSTTMHPLSDHVPPPSEEFQNTQVWLFSFVCETKKVITTIIETIFSCSERF